MPISAGQRAMDRFYAGQIVSLQHDTFYKGIQDEYVNKEGDIIPFGSFVIDDGVGEIKLPSTTGQTIIGAVGVQDRFERTEAGVSGIPVDQAMSVMYGGIIAVVTEVAITRGAAVFVRHTENGSPLANEARGRIRTDADGSNADALSNVKVLDDGAAGDLVRIQLNIDPLL